MDIYVLTYSQNLTWKELEGYLGCLTPARRRGILKKKQEPERINALLSRLLVLSELTRRTGIPQNKISFEFGKHGKPYIKNSSLQFSLSHTKRAICAAFSAISGNGGKPDASSAGEIGEIGIDIERRDRRVDPAIYDRTLAENEKPLVHSSEDFIRCWVQKEAFVKRTGFGIVSDLRGINTNILPDTAAFDYGDLIIGASGRGALDPSINAISLNELLGRYVKIN